MTKIIKIGTKEVKEVDLAPVLPLILRDWLALEEEGVTMDTMQHASVKTMHALAWYVIHKADPAFPADEVLNMTLAQLRDTFGVVGEAEKEEVPNRPSTTSSTSSP